LPGRAAARLPSGLIGHRRWGEQTLEYAGGMTQSVGESFSAHLRVVMALAVREMHASNSSYVYGYAWALLEVVISMTVLTIIKVFIHMFSPPAMPPVLFLLLGGIPWFLFHNTATGMMQVVSMRRKLLLLPQVTPIDIMLAKATTVLCTYSTVFIIGLLAADYFESGGIPRSVGGLVLVYFMSWILGIGFGMSLAPLIRLYSPSIKFLAVIWRFGMILSGVYFTITTIPSSYWIYLTWNPMLHVSELMRSYWFYSYQTPVGNPFYVGACTIGVLTLGLLLERYVRLRLPA
jgi:capsular polysaccharide transport system permease protein